MLLKTMKFKKIGSLAVDELKKNNAIELLVCGGFYFAVH